MLSLSLLLNLIIPQTLIYLKKNNKTTKGLLSGVSYHKKEVLILETLKAINAEYLGVLKNLKLNNTIAFICPCGFGDTLILCGFKDALEALYDANIHFIIKPKHEVIMKMYNIERYSMHNFNEEDLYRIAQENPTPQKGHLFVAHPLFLNKQGLLDAFNENKISFLNLHRKNLKLSDISEFKAPIKYPALTETFIARIEKIAPLNKIILIFPEAKSLKSINSHFFTELVEDLKANDYTIISSVIDKCNTIKGTKYVEMNVEEALALSLNCHSVYASRSGFCDLMAPIATNLTVYYPDIQAYNSYNLNKIYNNSNILETVVIGSKIKSITPFVILESKNNEHIYRLGFQFFRIKKTGKEVKFYIFGILIYRKKVKN